MRIFAEFHSNQDVVSLHTDVEFAGPKYHSPKRHGRPDLLGKKYSELMDSIESLEGIELVQFNFYEISVEKIRVFDWEELIPRIQSVIREYFSDDNIVIDLKKFAKKPNVANLTIERKLDQIIKLLSDIGGVLDGKLGIIINSEQVLNEMLDDKLNRIVRHEKSQDDTMDSVLQRLRSN